MIEEVLQLLDKLIAHHEALAMFESTNYHKGAFDALEKLRNALEELRDEIKQQKGGEE